MASSKKRVHRQNAPNAADALRLSVLVAPLRQRLTRSQHMLFNPSCGPPPEHHLFRVDGPIATLLKQLPRSPKQDALSLDQALAFLETWFLWHRAQASLAGISSWHQWLNEIRDELGGIQKKAIELAADIRGSDFVCRSLDIEVEATLTALENFAKVVDIKRKRLGAKSGITTSRDFAEKVVKVIEVYTGAKVERSGKRGSSIEILHGIFKLMDPAIGSGTIDEALKARSRARRETRTQKRGDIKRRKR